MPSICNKISSWLNELLISLEFKADPQKQVRTETQYPKPTPAAQWREDFIKRLFAVTLSVGIANQISAVLFAKANTIDDSFRWRPVVHEWRHLSLILISLAIIVSSWEGYLGAIQRLPLEDRWRFRIDIALVFSYLILTLSSGVYNLWFFMHTVIFLEYAAWDFCRSRLPAYQERALEEPEENYQKSMTITLVWLIYFIEVYVLKDFTPYFTNSIGFALIAVCALLGVMFYRKDKRLKWKWHIKLQMAGLLSLFPLGFMSYEVFKTIL